MSRSREESGGRAIGTADAREQEGAIIVLLVVPSLVWLFSLAQRGTLSESRETPATILAPGDGPHTGS